jgi:hypothetical protein
VALEFYVLALCPAACDLELRHSLSGKKLGRVSFEVAFQQVQDVNVSLQDLSVKLQGEVDSPLAAELQIVAGDATVSSPSIGLQRVGFKHLKNHTSYRGDFLDMSGVSVVASLELLKQSSFRVSLSSE